MMQDEELKETVIRAEERKTKAEDDAEEDMAAEERAERKVRRKSARAWMLEQRSVLQQEVESQLRWVEVQPERGPGGVLSRGGFARTLASRTSRAHSASLRCPSVPQQRSAAAS